MYTTDMVSSEGLRRAISSHMQEAEDTVGAIRTWRVICTIISKCRLTSVLSQQCIYMGRSHLHRATIANVHMSQADGVYLAPAQYCE